MERLEYYCMACEREKGESFPMDLTESREHRKETGHNEFYDGEYGEQYFIHPGDESMCFLACDVRSR